MVSKDLYPFGKGGFKIKFPNTHKVGSNKEEIRTFETIDNLTEMERHSLNVWLYSFYFAGMRVSDVLFTKWSMIYDNRLNYRIGKNSKIVSLKIPLKVMEILKYYEKDKCGNEDFIFPKMKKQI